MAEPGKDHVRWRGDIGPAFIALVLQTVGIVVAATVMYSQLLNTADNTKLTAQRLTEIVERQQDRQNVISERLIRAETILTIVEGTVLRIDKKLDDIGKKN